MQGQQRRLGELVTQLLAWTQNRDVRVVKAGDLVKQLGFTKRQEESLLYSLGKKQRIAKIRRGLYLVPRNIPLGGKWKPSPLIVVAVLMRELGATAWQLTGGVAFQRHGLSQQMSSRIDVYNDKLSGVKTILGQEFRFIKVNKKRLGNTVEFTVSEREGNYVIQMGSLARTVFDAIYDYDRFGVIEDAYGWLGERINDGAFMREFTGLVLKLGNIGVQRRVGYLLVQVKGGAKWAKKIQVKLPSSKGLIPLVPSKGRRGKVDMKWGVIVREK
jgi:predicted transcriptional regulator of viral defense system